MLFVIEAVSGTGSNIVYNVSKRVELTSVYDGKKEKDYTVEINTIEELIDLLEKVGNDLIIGHANKVEAPYLITIYDDYME